MIAINADIDLEVDKIKGSLADTLTPSMDPLTLHDCNI